MSKINKNLLIPVGVLGVLSLVITGIITMTQMTGVYTIGSSADLQTPPEIGVYWDITTLDTVTHINWGVLNVSTVEVSKTVTVYVKNKGNIDFTGSLSTDNWNPSGANDFITLDWDFGSNPLKVGRVRTTQFTLRVSPEITGITDFNFTIIITGTEVLI